MRGLRTRLRRDRPVSSDSGDHVCARCLVPLDREVPDEDRPDEWEWIHPAGIMRSDTSWVDHPPEPVPAGVVLEVRAHCDFCFDRDPTWRYPCESFPLDSLVGMGSDGDWAACDRCAALIEDGDAIGLLARSVAANPTLRTMVPELRAEFSKILDSLYEAFRAHRSGPRVPTRPPGVL